MSLYGNLKHFLSFCLIALVVASCTPGGGGKKSPSCGAGESFDSVKRACLPTTSPEAPPTPTTTYVTIVEDGGAQNVTLSYTDYNGDLATSCNIVTYSEGINDVAPTCSCTAGSCTATITPDANFNGSSDLTYTVTDNDGISSQKLVAVVVSAVNDAPVAAASILNVAAENTLTAGTVSATDVDGDSLSYLVSTAPTYGSLSLSTNGSYTYTPNVGVSDDDLKATLQIGGVRYNAVAAGTGGNNITVAYTAGAVAGAEVVSVVGNDISVQIQSGISTDLQIKTAVDASAPAMALVSTQLIGSKAVSAPVAATNLAGGRASADSFTFVANDGTVNSAAQTVTINVAQTATSPVPGSDNVVTTEDSAGVTFDLTYATEYDKTTNLTYTLTAAPTGTLTNCLGQAGSNGTADISCTYVPSANVSDDDAYATVIIGGLRYRAKTTGTSGNSITVEYTNTAVAGAETVTVVGSAITVGIQTGVSTSYQIRTAVLANASAAALVNILTLGSVPEVTTAATNLAGGRDYADSFTYQVDNGAAPVGTVTVPIALTTDLYADTPTAASPLAVGTTEDTAVVFTANQGSDLDPQDELSYTLTTAPTNGTLTNCMDQTGSDGSADLICTYTPNANYSGADSLVYTVTDKGGNNTTVTVNITVTDVNDAPVVCEYSHFNEASECSILGCYSDTIPVGNVTPTADGHYFYHKTTAACYVSSGGAWSLVAGGSYLGNKTINEKDKAIFHDVRIDEGGSGEDAQMIRVTAITSTNTTLIPTGNVKIYYDSDNDGVVETATEVINTSALPSAYFGAGTSEDAYPFRIEVTPVGGQNGSSTISITFEDDDGVPASTSVSFTVTVNSSSLTHNGWKNVQALGPKTNKFSQVKDSINVCNYSKNKCNTGGTCTGITTPVGAVVPDAINAIYYDSAAATCYYSTGVTNADWTSFTSVCNISPSEYDTECTGASCIGTASPSGVITPDRKNLFYYDRTNDICYKSYGTAANTDWEAYSATASVTFSWESFSTSGSGSISGYNIYRRLANENFDFKAPINKTTLSSSVTSYTDNATNSWFAPVPKSVYYYEVRPVFNSIGTSPSETFKKLRVAVPPNNMALVHRWIVNKSICSLMNGTVNPNSNFTCSYEGPGDTGLSSSNTYDLGKDYFVDRFEAGCNYSASPTCDTTDGQCIGANDPEGLVKAATNSIYYSRSSGKCFVKNSMAALATGWVVADGSTATARTDYNVAELPPFSNIFQNEAHDFCDGLSNVTNVVGLAADPNPKLPTRKEQIAYSLWDLDSLTDSSISTYEMGLSLNSSAKCNTTQANGLSSSFSNADVPDSNSFFTLPGTSSSTIRSLMTGSSKTNLCVSRFGVQDHVGNVGEWTAERIQCSAVDNSCDSVINSDGGIALASSADDMQAGDGSGSYDRWRLDGSIGPCVDTNVDGTCDNFLSNWAIDLESYSAGRWIIPMGLPAHTDFPFYNPASAVSPYLFEIGPTSGITADQLHSDEMTFNSGYIHADTNRCGAMSSGGGYNDNNGAGTWSFEFTQCTEPTNGFIEVAGVYLRATIGGVSVQVADPGPNNPALSIVGNPAIVITPATDAFGNPTTKGSELVGQFGAFPVDDFVVGDTTQTLSFFAQTFLTDNTTEYARREDLGFRCVAPVTTYDE